MLSTKRGTRKIHRCIKSHMRIWAGWWGWGLDWAGFENVGAGQAYNTTVPSEVTCRALVCAPNTQPCENAEETVSYTISPSNCPGTERVTQLSRGVQIGDKAIMVSSTFGQSMCSVVLLWLGALPGACWANPAGRI